MDSTEIPVYGEQEQGTYDGHFESTFYHPLLLFNREGDCLAVNPVERDRQRARRRGVGGTAAAGKRATAEARQGGRVPGGPGLLQTGERAIVLLRSHPGGQVSAARQVGVGNKPQKLSEGTRRAATATPKGRCGFELGSTGPLG